MVLTEFFRIQILIGLYCWFSITYLWPIDLVNGIELEANWQILSGLLILIIFLSCSQIAESIFSGNTMRTKYIASSQKKTVRCLQTWDLEFWSISNKQFFVIQNSCFWWLDKYNFSRFFRIATNIFFTSHYLLFLFVTDIASSWALADSNCILEVKPITSFFFMLVPHPGISYTPLRPGLYANYAVHTGILPDWTLKE